MGRRRPTPKQSTARCNCSPRAIWRARPCRRSTCKTTRSLIAIPACWLRWSGSASCPICRIRRRKTGRAPVSSTTFTVSSPAGRVLQVAFSSRDPDLSARGANAVADLYADLQLQAGRERARQAAQNSKPPISVLEARVAEAEASVNSFRASASVSSGQPDEIAASLAEARAAQSTAEARASSLHELLRQNRLADAGDISLNEEVRRLSEQRMLARSKLAAALRTLLPAHPRMKEVLAQLAAIETQLRAALEKAARGLDDDARIAEARVATLTTQMEEHKRAAEVFRAEMAHLRSLQGDAKRSATSWPPRWRNLKRLWRAPTPRRRTRAFFRAPSRRASPTFRTPSRSPCSQPWLDCFSLAGAVATRARNFPRAPPRVPPPPREMVDLAPALASPLPPPRRLSSPRSG